MIIIKLTGGLGNQLFQYAYGRALSLERKEKLALDISWYKGRINRSYMLDQFAINAKPAHFLDKLFAKTKLADTTGEWHNEKFFKKYENDIRKEFTLKRPFSPKIQEIHTKITSTNSVSIHLRGTDYITKYSGFHGVSGPEYYEKAVQYIKNKVSNPHFFVFTDDVAWAKQHITFPEPYTIVSETKSPPEEELLLMAACKHNIIANSTFSWWAAWLNKNKNKMIITPSRWFADEKANSAFSLPSTWIQM